MDETQVKPRRAVKVLGKSIPVVVILGILMSGVAMAALVSYMSNTQTVTATVNSPLTLAAYDNGIGTSPSPCSTSSGDYGTTEIDKSLYGGETMNICMYSHNLASVSEMGNTRIFVYNPDGVTCGDFSAATYGVDSIIGNCYQGLPTTNGNDLTHVYFTLVTTWAAHQEAWDALSVTFQENVGPPGTIYTFNGVITPR
jgi:hypothetical protein